MYILLKSFFMFRNNQESGDTVTHLVIKSIISMVYSVAPMCHYSKQRKVLFCFIRTKMSKISPILRVTGW